MTTKTKINQLRILKSVLPNVPNTIWKELQKACTENKTGVVTLMDSPEMLDTCPSLKDDKETLALLNIAIEHYIIKQEMVTEIVDLGIAPKGAINLYEHGKFGKRTLEKLKKNPYEAAEIPGVQFEELDTIAAKLNYSDNDRARKIGALRHCVYLESTYGNSFTATKDIVKRAQKLLTFVPKKSHWKSNSVSSNDLESLLEKIRTEKGDSVIQFSKTGEKIFYKPIFFSEVWAAKHITRIMQNKSKTIPVSTHLISNWQLLNTLQQKAIKNAWEHPISIICGLPGTGKTTVLRSIVELYEKNGLICTLIAPTARAAQRMQEATAHEAQTIHRCLGIYNPLQAASKNNPFENIDCVIVDESSMIDIYTLAALLSKIETQTLVFVGDHNQLQPVGPGKAFQRMVEEEWTPVARLTQEYRTLEDSGIRKLSRNVLFAEKDESIIFPDTSDICWIETNSNDVSITALKETVVKLLQAGNAMDSIQILSPRHNGTMGTNNINVLLQRELLNSQTVAGFKVGSRILQVKNDYWNDVYNGEIGTVIEVHQKTKTTPGMVTAQFDDRKITRIGIDILNNWELGFCTTVHKAQGGEVPIVILCFPHPQDSNDKKQKGDKQKEESQMWNLSLLYTAITRAREQLILIGSKQCFLDGTQTKAYQRREYLKYRIKQCLEFVANSVQL